MSPEEQNIILSIWKSKPDGTKYPIAALEDIEDFEETHKKIPQDYRWFLLNCGGGTIGSEWVEGIDELYCIHQKYHEECHIPNGYSHPEHFIIGWEGSGSPILLTKEGAIVIEHPGEELQELGSSFAKWVIMSEQTS